MRLTGMLSAPSLPSALRVARIRAKEGLSQLFDATVDFVTDDPDIDLEAILGAEAVLAIDADDGSDAWRFHGIIEEAAMVGRRSELFVYQLRLRPNLAGLERRFRSRIFQAQSPFAVIKDVLSGAGIPEDKTDWGISPSEQREYLTQYRETELNLVLRLLEEEGIFYWFDHSEDGHKLCFADSPSAHRPIESPTHLALTPWEGRGDLTDCVTALSYSGRVESNAFVMRDWVWRNPEAPPSAKNKVSDDSGLERYEFPGGFADPEKGKAIAKRRLQAERGRCLTLTGKSPCRRLASGRMFELTGARPDSLNRKYLLLEVEHHFSDPGAETSGEAMGTYEATFTAIPDDVEFRPPRVTPKPLVSGKELAVITGPAGEEIHVDDFGRVKVHFYWDREGTTDDKASCWIRVQQQNTSGSLVLPRVGWEVEVGFLYGDPDRPIVMQKLYNDANRPPYALPDNLMQSALQSSSSPGGGGTNEIRMDDSAGGMMFFVHAQKDFALNVGNDLIEEITADETVQVKVDLGDSVGGTEHITISGTQKVSVTGFSGTVVAGSQNVNVGGTDDWGVTGPHAVTVGGSREESVGGLLNVLAQKVTETFNADHTRTVGGALCINSAGPIIESVAGAKNELVGGAKIELISKSKAENIGVGKILNAGLVKIKTGKDISYSAKGAIGIQAGGPVAIKCGGDLNITGKRVTINVGKAKLKAGAQIQMTPAKVTIKGSSFGGDASEVTIKGNIKYR